MKQNKKFSILNRILIILLDIIILNLVIFYLSEKGFINLQFIVYITVFWILIAFYTKFYQVYRYTNVIKLISLLASQFIIFLLSYFSYFSLFEQGTIISNQLTIVITFVAIITVVKFSFFFLWKDYRTKGNSFRNVIVLGESKSAENIVTLFRKNQDFGYRFHGFFSDKSSKTKEYLGSIKEGLSYCKKNNIDEIYCEASSLTRKKIKEIRSFCDANNINFSLIPENKAIYSKDFVLEYYGIIPVLKPKKLPFERFEVHFIKRFFDIVFSLFVCLFLLSWILPILWIFVRIDSKGPFLFKQLRDGVDGKQFYCYKIRSMKVNQDADRISASKNDSRITKFGAILRKTSLDELPQFFNVLKGDMSVVGPRPHMNAHTEKYLKEIGNYLIRNSVKPGITGLAQISGFRGEVIHKSDIKNRVRLDIFYIENWSFVLDIKIIIQTVISVFKEEEKAY